VRPAVRLGVFLAGAAGLGALLLWAYAGLPDFGHYTGRYGLLLNEVGVQQRHATDVVTAVVFDYRGFDTLGEELILFASAVGVALLLRETRDEHVGRPLDRQRSDAVRAVGLAAVGITLVTGLYVVAHGYITPGGGFQGGVVLAGALLLVYLAGDYKGYRAVSPTPLVDLAEGTGAGTYVVVGAIALLLGNAYLHNLLPLGKAGTLASAGSIVILNVAVGLEVAAALVLVSTEFVEEWIDAETRSGRG
jgi:multicomponent Na+:H+ antiporter subunit B